jgi:hypothetical protein
VKMSGDCVGADRDLTRKGRERSNGDATLTTEKTAGWKESGWQEHGLFF